MLETIIKLLERFVVAHELIAANSAKTTLIEKVGDVVHAVEKSTGGDKPQDEETEDKPAKKTRAPRKAAEPKGPDLDKLRDEIKTIAKAIAAGDSDDCADKFDDLLDEYHVRTVTKLPDEDIESFHKSAKTLVGKYYDIED